MAQVEELVDHALATKECEPVAAVCELAHWMATQHRVWLLTGSPEVLGVIVGRRLGLRNFHGIKLRMERGVLLPETYGTTTCGEGKVHAAWVITGRIPVFAIGDSPHDLPLCATHAWRAPAAVSLGSSSPRSPESLPDAAAAVRVSGRGSVRGRS